MRLIDLAVAYLVVGVGCAWALRARRSDATATTLADTLLTFTLWPLYVPVLLGPAQHGPRAEHPSRRAVSPRIARERALLVEAIDAAQARMTPGALASLLPTHAQLASLTDHLERLDAKVQELDEVLAGEEFDLARAERKLRESDRAGVESATAAVDGARRLSALRERAARERDELLGLCARLRMQVTVLRFAEGAPSENLAELVSELLGRVEGVGAALDPSAHAIS
jgi:hypothetical protein